MRYVSFFFTLLITALLAACALSGGSSAASLQGEWTLSTLNGKAPLAGTTITAAFENRYCWRAVRLQQLRRGIYRQGQPAQRLRAGDDRNVLHGPRRHHGSGDSLPAGAQPVS